MSIAATAKVSRQRVLPVKLILSASSDRHHYAFLQGLQEFFVAYAVAHMLSVPSDSLQDGSEYLDPEVT